MQPSPPPPSHLDSLHLCYLETLDTYQSQIAALSAALASSHLALSKANYISPPPGGDTYSPKLLGEHTVLRPRWRIDRLEGGGFEAAEVGAEVEEEEDEKHDGSNGGGELRQRKRKPVAETPQPPAETKPKRQQQHEPLTHFHALPPRLLRDVAAEFSGAIPKMAELAGTLHTLSGLSAEIEHHRREDYVYKILLDPPQWPLELSPLDRSSGYVHLCTAAQVLGVLKRFMKDVQLVWVLKLRYEDIAHHVKWEEVDEDEFPHLFADLERGVVEETGSMQREAEVWSLEDWEGVEWEKEEAEKEEEA
jgi:uncharacterized protein (DUF952 family)